MNAVETEPLIRVFAKEGQDQPVPTTHYRTGVALATLMSLIGSLGPGHPCRLPRARHARMPSRTA